jgi:hypothetical protein
VEHQLLDACTGSRRVSREAGWKVAPSTALATLPVGVLPHPRTLFWLARFSRGVCVDAVEGGVCFLAARPGGMVSVRLGGKWQLQRRPCNPACSSARVPRGAYLPESGKAVFSAEV